MRVLVTGSNGFIGSALSEQLLKEADVRCLIRKTSNTRWIRDLDVEFVYADLRYPETLADAVRDVDVVYHTGGVTKGRKEEDYMLGNYQTTVNLLEASRQYGPDHQKIVMVSSQAAGGAAVDGRPRIETDPPEPVSRYGRSKLKAEQVLLGQSDRPAVVIRPPSVYGPRDKDFYIMFRQIKRGLVPIAGLGRQTLSLVYVSDLVEGIMRAGNSPNADHQIYYISGNGVYTWKTLTRAMQQSMGRMALRLYIPKFLVTAVAWVSEASAIVTDKPALLNRDKIREMKQSAWVCSNEKAKQELGFEPGIDINQGFQRTADWYKQVGWL
ncbi:MAG: NAD(P)-dependent oxidoreductase [candidate division KSB1 bacterium]|nr:NAD(P)-dependent oxidoreductase [candidate division KSB1 bacterium]